MSQVPAACKFNMSVTKMKNYGSNVDELQNVKNDTDLPLRQIITTYDIEKVR